VTARFNRRTHSRPVRVDRRRDDEDIIERVIRGLRCPSARSVRDDRRAESRSKK
jgi:hypothetical protein